MKNPFLIWSVVLAGTLVIPFIIYLLVKKEKPE
jgi:hypothetical protein